MFGAVYMQVLLYSYYTSDSESQSIFVHLALIEFLVCFYVLTSLFLSFAAGSTQTRPSGQDQVQQGTRTTADSLWIHRLRSVQSNKKNQKVLKPCVLLLLVGCVLRPIDSKVI